MNLNIRTRIIAVAVIAILPAVILIFYTNNHKRIDEQNQQFENLVTVAKIYSAEHSQVIEDARHLLLALSVSPEVNSKNNTVCSTFLNSLLTKYKRYSNFGVSDLNGNIICSANPLQQPTNVSDTLFFKQTVEENDFAVGGYRISTVTKDAIISFGYPINDGVIYSSVDIDWFNQFTKNLTSFDKITTFVIDQNGTVIAKSNGGNELIGKKLSTGPLLLNIQSSSSGTVTDYDNDGVLTAYAFEKIGSLPNSLFIVSSIPMDIIFKETQSDFTKSLLLSTLVALFSIGFAWWAGGILIVKEVESLKRIDLLKNDFISLVSHQIRTPLTSIRWLSEILTTLDKYKLPKKQKDIMNDIHDISSNIIDFVGVFLNISKIESNKIRFEFKKNNIKDVINEVKKEIGNIISKKRIVLDIDVKKNALIFDFDSKYLCQVFMNLIGNAIKYSSQGDHVKITVKKKGNDIVTSISDNGIGIPDLEKSKIFQKFSRANNAISYSPDGSGLGLYLVKIIIEAHNGKIWFKNNKPKGTTFIFSLPASQKL